MADSENTQAEGKETQEAQAKGKETQTQKKAATAAATCRILSFCGGGIRGLMSTTLLKLLNQKCPGILDQATFLAGTSTGTDIISLILTGMSPDDVDVFFRNLAPGAFKGPNGSPDLPAYQAQDLFNTQTKLHGGNPAISSFTKYNLLFTSFNVQDSKTGWTPMLYNNFLNSPTGNVGVADAVVGSSAMPGMYGSWNGCVDGAFVNHDPTLAAIALAVQSGIELQNISAICFGTGFYPNYIASDTSQWGATQWLNGDGNAANQLPFLLVNQTTTTPILNMTMNGTSTSLSQQLSAMMLGPRYAYVNATLARPIPENDILEADLDYLVTQAQSVDLSAAEAVLTNYWT